MANELITTTKALKECMASLGLNCAASDTVIDLAEKIPYEMAMRIIAAATLIDACP